MSHADEGTLHAYLDQGRQPSEDWREVEDHLAACAECRQRLEEARALRERAATILRASGPAAVPVPPFDAVLARAGGRRPRRVLSLNRLTALGWAASIALAVGVGWMARGTLNPLRSPDQPLTLRTSQTAPVDTVTPRSSVDARPGTASVAKDAGSTETAAERLRSAYEVPADEAPAGRRDALQQNAAAEPAAQGAPAAAAPRARLARDIGAVAERREQPTRELAAELEADRTPVQWVQSDRADAATRLGETPHTVPGVPVVSIDRDAQGDGRGVRVLQDLNGVMLEIIQRPVSTLEGRVEDAVAADAPRMADTAATAITVVRGNAVLTLRANIPLDSLRSLAARIP
ncbi:MAG: hypothetical protein OEO17_00215 [Gemmatimonadota bacterium]|nr:hypothetical protein [Gemmatimonadota bacterium]